MEDTEGFLENAYDKMGSFNRMEVYGQRYSSKFDY